MAEIKVSELPEASSTGDDDIIMIIQGNVNKKISFQAFNRYINSEILTIKDEINDLKEKNAMTITKTQNQNISVNQVHTIVFMDSVNSVGDKLNFINNSIKIGSGLTKVLVSGMAWVSVSDGYKWLVIKRKRGNNYYDISQAITPRNNIEGWDSVNLAPKIIDVQEGDELSLWVAITGNVDGTVSGGTYINSCFLTVEAIL